MGHPHEKAVTSDKRSLRGAAHLHEEQNRYGYRPWE